MRNCARTFGSCSSRLPVGSARTTDALRSSGLPQSTCGSRPFFFNRYFYRYVPPRRLEEIDTDIQDIEKMLKDMSIGQPD